jgi:hypothetical protein
MLGITARAGTNRGRLRGTRRGDVVLVGRGRQLLLRASLAELGLCKRGENVQCSDAATQQCRDMSDILRVRTDGKGAHQETLSECACCRRLLEGIKVESEIHRDA